MKGQGAEEWGHRQDARRPIARGKGSVHSVPLVSPFAVLLERREGGGRREITENPEAQSLQGSNVREAGGEGQREFTQKEKLR